MIRNYYTDGDGNVHVVSTSPGTLNAFEPMADRPAYLIAADLGEARATLLVLRETLGELADYADDALAGERHLPTVVGYLVDRLTVLSGGGR